MTSMLAMILKAAFRVMVGEEQRANLPLELSFYSSSKDYLEEAVCWQ